MKTFALLPLLLCSTAAFAPAALAQATPQGAADLLATFQTYLGKTPGVVNVVADGDAYAVTLDAAPLIAMRYCSGSSIAHWPASCRSFI